MFGIPGSLLSDRGTNFLSVIVKHLCDIIGTRKINTSSYHPSTNGQNERLNRVLYNSLSAVVSQKADNWDEFLQASLFAYRVTPSAETTNASPFQLLFGQHPILPIDRDLQLPEKAPASLRSHLQHNMDRVQLFRELAAQQLKDNKARMKKFYDQRASNAKFVLGDEVWLYCPRLLGPECPKLRYHWHGPYYLCEQISPVLFKLRQSSDNRLLRTPVHVNRLKIAWARHLHRPKDTEMPKDQPTDDLTLKQDDLPCDSLDKDTSQSNKRDSPPVQDTSVLNPHSMQLPNDSASPDVMAPASPTSDTPQDDTSNEPEYTIRKIIRGRYRKGKPEYLIHWKGYTVRDRTWEPLENLNQTARDYVAKHPVKMTGTPPASQ